MPAKLLYRDGEGRDAAVDIPEGSPIFLGRGADCAVRTDDAMVSRKNCKISFMGGRCVVEDLGSANGTYVNEQRIQKQPLRHADVIRCGVLQVRYVEVAASPSAKPAAPRTQELNVGDGPGTDETGTPESLLAERDASLAALVAERDTIQKKLEELQPEVESLRARIEATEGELTRLRTEAFSGKDELAKIKRDAAQDKEELHAVNRLTEELRQESRTLKEEAVTLRSRVEELGEEVAARDRQLGRAQDEVQGTKKTLEEFRNKLGELQKTKDEGWRELNSQLSQVEHLREVISEQERILEERRVGLISLESAAKDLRAEKEKVLRELVDTRNQRDELRDKLNRAEAKVEGLEEEQRRLARVMSEGGAASSEDAARLSKELRELKVEFKKLENDRGRGAEALGRAEQDRDKLLEQRAHDDVERAQLLEEKQTAEAARTRAEEARARAESLRQQAQDERQQTAAARDTALATVDDLRRGLERAERRVAELEKAPEQPSGTADAAEVRRLEEARDAAMRARTNAEARVAQLMDELEGLRAQVQGVQTESASDETDPGRPAAALGGEVAGAEPSVAAEAGDALRAKAQEVYEGINEALSELRTTIITAKGLFGEVGPMVADEDARRALADALVNSMERTEDAKGLLRGLRELARG